MDIALVYSFKPSEWFSCTVINKNLRLAYQAAFGEKNIIHIDYTRDRKIAEDDLKKLADLKVKKIIFIDHKPTPIDFLLQLKSLEPEYFKTVEYSIHVFGDFPLYLREWRSVFDLLDNLKLKFIAASVKQKKFVQKFLHQKDIVEVSPFPVKEESFTFDEKKRLKYRKELGLDKEKVFLYTGRLTYQKRITDLIEIFIELLKEGRLAKDSKLLLVGSVDMLGMPYLGFSQLLGEYFRDIEKKINLNKEFENNVVLVGRVENSELERYYLASDCFVSLSTYHDEDYGMSVAEALNSGLPAIITDWAGYSSFQLDKAPQYCQLISTELTSTLPSYDRESFQKKLESFGSNQFNREEISALYHGNFGIKHCADNLKSFQEQAFEPFKGSTDFMKRVTNEQFLRGMEIFKSESSREFNPLYFEAYDVYAE